MSLRNTSSAWPRSTRSEWRQLSRSLGGLFRFANWEREEFDHVLEYLTGGGESLRRQYAELFGKIVIEDGTISLARPRVAREFFAQHRHDRVGRVCERFVWPPAPWFGRGRLYQAT